MKRLLVILITLSSTLYAQQAYLNDAQFWLKLSVKKKISDRFSIQLKNQDRFTNNVSEFGRFKADLGVIYKITDGVRVKLGVALIERQKASGAYSERYRWYAALYLKKEIRRWNINYRNLFQWQYVDMYTSDDGFIPYLYDRHKLTVEYEFTKRISAYVAQEFFIPLNDPEGFTSDQSRSFLGLFYNLTKNQQLEFFFLHKLQLRDSDWFKQRNSYSTSLLSRDFVYGVGYSFSF